VAFISTKASFMFRLAGIVVLLALITSPLLATDTSWVLPAGQSGDWSVGLNWTAGVPNSSIDAWIGNGGTATVSSIANCNSLQLGTTAGSGTLRITGGSLSMNNGMAYVGVSGTGNIIQSNGSLSVLPGYGLFMGNSVGCKGTYNLTGGLVSGQCLLVGSSGAADFAQSGGTVSAPGWFEMASWNPSSATYELQGGLLSASEEFIGDRGTADFAQSGGTNTITVSYLELGTNSGGVGTYELVAGQLSAPYEGIGAYSTATGIFTQSGGTNTIGYRFLLGNSTQSNGTYNLNGGRLVTNEIAAGYGTVAFNFGGGTLAASTSFLTGVPMTLTHAGGNANVDTTSGDITLAGVLSGSGGLNKLGMGTLTLSAANTYRGDTLVLRGTLVLANTGALVLDVNDDANSQISVASGAELDIYGTIKLDIDDVTASSGSWMLVSNSGTTLYEPSFALTTNDGESFAPVNNMWSYTAGTQRWTFTEATGMLSLTTVPEPSSLALLAIGAISLLGYAWHRRRACPIGR
jgi:autotransporter-associated beta strand protein